MPNWSKINSSNRKRGNKAESNVEQHLYAAGFRSIYPIETGVRIISVVSRKGGKILAWFFHKKKVQGDFTALDREGRGCQIEVKAYRDKLSLSYLSDDQKLRMADYAANGGRAIIVWVDTSQGGEIYMIDWENRPIKNHPLKVEQARAVAFYQTG